MWWVTLIVELAKLLIPIIQKIKKDEKPNPVAMRDMVDRLSYAVEGPTEIKR